MHTQRAASRGSCDGSKSGRGGPHVASATYAPRVGRDYMSIRRRSVTSVEPPRRPATTSPSRLVDKAGWTGLMRTTQDRLPDPAALEVDSKPSRKRAATPHVYQG